MQSCEVFAIRRNYQNGYMVVLCFLYMRDGRFIVPRVVLPYQQDGNFLDAVSSPEREDPVDGLNTMICPPDVTSIHRFIQLPYILQDVKYRRL
jgi:hypothetical protein